MNLKNVSKKDLVLYIVGAVLLIAVICACCIVAISPFNGKISGKWITTSSSSSSFKIDFKKEGACTVTVSNNVFSVNDAGQNEMGTDKKEYVGNYNIDENKVLTISVDG